MLLSLPEPAPDKRGRLRTAMSRPSKEERQRLIQSADHPPPARDAARARAGPRPRRLRCRAGDALPRPARARDREADGRRWAGLATCCPAGRRGPSPREALAAILGRHAQSVTAAQNIVVIRSELGSAPAIARALDRVEHPLVVGTLAGDDTCLVIARTPATQRARLRARLGVLGTRRSVCSASRSNAVRVQVELDPALGDRPARARTGRSAACAGSRASRRTRRAR